LGKRGRKKRRNVDDEEGKRCGSGRVFFIIIISLFFPLFWVPSFRLLLSVDDLHVGECFVVAATTAAASERKGMMLSRVI
jgi:hypothetical protein